MSALRLSVAASCLALSATAHAKVEFVLQTGKGFDDPTAVAPVGDNPGKTLGEQRRQLLLHALTIWSGELESKVPIVVRAEFDKLECNERGAVVGGASPTGWIARRLPGNAPPVIYPMALGDRLAGRDVAPGQPDIYIVFNSALDESPCRERLGSPYYGFDGAGGTKIDLLGTALHELAHGLGFASTVDEGTGELEIPLGVDVFSTHIRDLDLDATWDELTPAERARSTGNVRRLVFDGPATTRAAGLTLARGEPTLTLEPYVAGYSGYVADVGFALNPAQNPVRGKVAIADPVDGCTDFKQSVLGKILLIEPNPARCRGRDSLERARRAGAAAVLLVTQQPVDRPALPISAGPQPISLPIVTIGESDAVSIARALARREVEGSLGGDPYRSVGADADGRPFLFASFPSVPGSSVSHFDPLARPDLLMEPYTATLPTLDLDLTVAVMRDIGWITDCGNAQLDPGEACDEGDGNGDVPWASCRENCQKPACGDAVLDEGEACDDGGNNSDRRPNACRSSCKRASCGDGTVDEAEACDGTADCSPTCQRLSPAVPATPATTTPPAPVTPPVRPVPTESADAGVSPLTER